MRRHEIFGKSREIILLLAAAGLAVAADNNAIEKFKVVELKDPDVTELARAGQLVDQAAATLAQAQASLDRAKNGRNKIEQRIKEANGGEIRGCESSVQFANGHRELNRTMEIRGKYLLITTEETSCNSLVFTPALGVSN